MTTEVAVGRLWELPERVLGACIEVHRHLGPLLLESAYEQCLCHELSLNGLSFARQKPLPVIYKGVMLDCGHRLDVVVEEKLVLELKAVDHLPVSTIASLSGVTGTPLVQLHGPAPAPYRTYRWSPPRRNDLSDDANHCGSEQAVADPRCALPPRGIRRSPSVCAPGRKICVGGAVS
ncbi:GxxExxY protein [Sorangium sp. So ce388]|uniref:GxxExxY protein n=1 Tax=Sorangium sp. So ce388 TaxID=3133309 RepID=UPI003F5C99D8